MDDRQRYLKQQAELGGAEVVLSRKATELVTTASRRDAESPSGRDAETASGRVAEVKAEPNRPAQLEVTGRMPSASRRVAESPSAPSTIAEVPQLQDTGQVPAVKRSGTDSPQPTADSPQKAKVPAGSWRRGAPPVPGPGLSIDPPVTFPELATLNAVAQVIAGCRKCALCEGRTNTVPGEGPPDAKFVVVGEGPGATEDELGRPFVGRAGALLDDILGAVDIPRSSAYILNIVKCRPPENRTPLPDEAAACLPYLHRQLAILRPKVILAAGGTAISHLLQSKQALGKLRGQVHRYAGIPVIATYHPAYLLRDPRHKKETWDDVRIARQLFDA